MITSPQRSAWLGVAQAVAGEVPLFVSRPVGDIYRTWSPAGSENGTPSPPLPPAPPTSIAGEGLANAFNDMPIEAIAARAARTNQVTPRCGTRSKARKKRFGQTMAWQLRTTPARSGNEVTSAQVFTRRTAHGSQDFRSLRKDLKMFAPGREDGAQQKRANI